MPVGLVGQLLLQPLARLNRLAALQLLGLDLALELGHVPLQLRDGLCKAKKESCQRQCKQRRKPPGRSGPPAQQPARISGATPSVCAGAPPLKTGLRTLAPLQLGSPAGERLVLVVVGGHTHIVIVLHQNQQDIQKTP
jgi:hypothetical protein